MKIDTAEVERRIERFRDAARRAGLKLTHQRLEIFREVAASLDHPSAEAVLKAVQPRAPTLSLDTVYRTLWMLHGLGVISTLGSRRESVRFDPNLAQHHHYVCTRCGLARDFESPELNALAIPAPVKRFGTILGAQVEVRGVCGQCSRASKPTPSNRPRGQRRAKERSRT